MTAAIYPVRRAESRFRISRRPWRMCWISAGDCGGKWNRCLPFLGFRLGTQLLARAHDGEALLVEQLLDMQDAFHIPSAVHALPGAAFHRLELRELALPEAQHVGGSRHRVATSPMRKYSLSGMKTSSVLFLPALFFLGLILASTVRDLHRLSIVTQARDRYEEFRERAESAGPLSAPLCKTEMPLKRCFS